MSKRNRREHGRIISVETLTRGDALAADVAAGATSITVNDAGDFDEDGGWLYIGAQTVEYTACDDDTGVITLAAPLGAAGEEGDPVHVWSDLYAEVVDYQQALVELDGEYDNPDPVVAEVAEGVGDLPEGDRGKAGESCTLLRVADDEWEVVGVGGRGRKSSRNRWEQDDFYALTAGDISAASATMPLSHRPNNEALTCYLAGTPQQPTEWTIDYDAQTLTIPLDGWEEVGDVLWVHYAYRKGVTTPHVPLNVVGVTGGSDAYASHPDTSPGDLMVMFLSISDARQAVTDPLGWTRWPTSATDIVHGEGFPWYDTPYGMQVWTKVATGSGPQPAPVVTTTTDPNWITWTIATVTGPTAVDEVAYASYDPGVASAAPPVLPNGDLSFWQTFNDNLGYVAPAGVTVHRSSLSYRADLLTDYTEAAASQVGGAVTEWLTCAVRFQ